MYSVVAVILLVVAFAILVLTFLWVGRLLGLWSDGGEEVADIATAAAGEQVAGPEETGEEAGLPPTGGVGADGEDAEGDPEAEAARGRAVILGANYGLVLGILACILFKVSWLMLMLSVAGIVYSARALYQGIRYYRIVVYRALIGFVLSLLSVGLQYLELTGQLAEMITLFPG